MNFILSLSEEQERDLVTSLTCILCTERKPKQRILPCLHSFCDDCLASWREACSDEGLDGFSCPTCRHLCDLDEAGIESYPVNTSIEQAFRNLCRCDNGVRRRMCLHCQRSLCRTCLDDHERTMQRQIEETIRPLRNELANVEQEAGLQLARLRETQSKLVSSLAEREQQETEITSQIHKTVDDIESALQQRQQGLLNELPTLFPTDIESIFLLRDELSGHITNLETMCTAIVGMSNDEIGRNGQSKLESFKQELSASNALPLYEPSPLQDVTYCDERDNIVRAVSTFGNIYVGSSEENYPTQVIVIRDVDEEFYPCSVIVVPTTGNLIISDKGSNMVHIVTSDGHPVLKFGGYGTECGQFKFQGYSTAGGLAITCDNRILVADTGNNRIQIFSEQGDFMECYGCGSGHDLDSPTDVAVNDAGIMFIADYGHKRIVSLSLEGNFNVLVSDQVGFWLPVSVSVTGSIICVGDAVGLVHLFTTSGEHGKTFGRTSEHESRYLANPLGVCWLTRDILVVSDADLDRVLVVQIDGVIVRTIGGPGNMAGRLRRPTGICSTDDKRIVVADQYNNRIQIFR